MQKNVIIGVLCVAVAVLSFSLSCSGKHEDGKKNTIAVSDHAAGEKDSCVSGSPVQEDVRMTVQRIDEVSLADAARDRQWEETMRRNAKVYGDYLKSIKMAWYRGMGHKKKNGFPSYYTWQGYIPYETIAKEFLGEIKKETDEQVIFFSVFKGGWASGQHGMMAVTKSKIYLSAVFEEWKSRGRKRVETTHSWRAKAPDVIEDLVSKAAVEFAGEIRFFYKMTSTSQCVYYFGFYDAQRKGYRGFFTDYDGWLQFSSESPRAKKLVNLIGTTMQVVDNENKEGDKKEWLKKVGLSRKSHVKGHEKK